MVIVNPLTSQILKSHKETSFDNYFDWRYRKDAEEELLEIRAIEFPSDDSYFLGGPVWFQDKTYGMAYFRYKKDCHPIAEIEADQIKRSSRFQSLLYTPHKYLAAITKYLDPHSEHPTSAATEFFYDPETKRSFSGLDLRFGGSDEIGHMVVTRGKKHSRAQAKKEGKTDIWCGAFWTTQIAEERISSYIGKHVVEETIERQLKSAHEINAENRKVAFCKERPYVLYLLGTDDASYTKNFASKEEMYTFATRIKGASSEFVTSQMTFTN